MNLKAVLLDLLQHAYREEQVFIEKLSDEERAVVGTDDQWSVKDLIAHVAAWKERTAQELAAAVSDVPAPEGDNLDQVNARIFEKHRDWFWSQVLELSKQAYEALCRQVETVRDEDLNDTEAIEWYNKPLWRLVIDDGLAHPISHFAEYYASHGDEALAARIRQEADDLCEQFTRCDM